MFKKIVFSVLLLSLLSCKSGKESKPDMQKSNKEEIATFDKTKWSIKKSEDYLYREKMLNDVVYNDTIRNLAKEELFDLLGEPDRQNEGHLYYTIAQTRLGFWPLRTKTMVIKLSKQDSIDWIKIHQ